MYLIGRLYFTLNLVKDILKKSSLSEDEPLISKYLTEFSQVFDTYHSEWKKYIYKLRKREVAMNREKEGTELKRRRDTVEEELEQSSQGHEFSLIYKALLY